MSLSARVIFGFILTLLLVIGSIHFALTLPHTGLTFSTDGDHLLLQDGEDTLRIQAFRIHGHLIPAHARFLIEEPDVLPDYASYNALIADLDALAQAAAANELSMVLADSERTVTLTKRGLGDLPGLFWLQLFCAAAAMVICVLVWAARPRNLTVRLFAATGIGYMLSSLAAAIYSTREMMIPAELFLGLSWLNHIGALLFAGSLTGLFWNMPLRLAGNWLFWAIYGTCALLITANILQWYHAPTMLYASVLVLFIPGIIGSILQWQRTRTRPSDRAALSWMLLSIYAGTLFYTFLMIVPVLLGIPAPASQGLLLTTFLLMYAGVALGVTRYRLFELERWWFHIWSWFLGGIAVVLLDLLLVSILALSGPVILGIAVAVVGWLYFPLRQWAWARWVLKRRGPLDDWLDKALPHLLAAREDAQLEPALQRTLNAVLEPLENQARPGRIEAVEVQENGAALALPIPGRGQHLLLRHAGEGRRLFTPSDARTVERVLALYTLVQETIRAETAGARDERERIRRDIHDDLGAKLLTLLHRSDRAQQSLVREAIQDLRDLLGALETEAVPLEAALAQWQNECQGRCEDASVTLHWHQQLPDSSPDLAPRTFLHLTRVLREAVSNALRHAQPGQLNIHMTLREGHVLRVAVENDGQCPVVADWQPGRGCQIMRQRIEGLAGNVSWQRENHLWRVQWEVPLIRDTGFAQAAG